MKESLSHRMSAMKLHITDEHGCPVANQRIRLKQTNHAFLFGCGAFDTLTHVTEPTAFTKQRVEEWLALYNYGTLPFYWSAFEPVEGQPQTESRRKAAQFLVQNGVKVKGHPLCWHTACADWLLKYDNDTILKKQLDRIHREVSDFSDTIDFWDVINEVVIMPVFDRYDNAITRLCKEHGRVGLIKLVFEAAKETNPNCTLLLNDFVTSEAYEHLISDCLEAGVPIGAIGIQSHQHQGYWGAEKLHRVLERYEHFGLPIHFTENTLVSGEAIPPEIVDLNDFHYSDTASTRAGEERQARETEEMYRILFEHPLVEAITGWDFADGAWLNAPSGVIRKDNSKKPVYHALQNLIHGEWWTDVMLETDTNGDVTFEGFLGSYEALSDTSKAAFELRNDTKEMTLKLP